MRFYLFVRIADSVWHWTEHYRTDHMDWREAIGIGSSETHISTPSFVCAVDLSSGSQAFTANTWPTEPPPQPFYLYFKMIPLILKAWTAELLITCLRCDLVIQFFSPKSISSNNEIFSINMHLAYYSFCFEISGHKYCSLAIRHTYCYLDAGCCNFEFASLLLLVGSAVECQSRKPKSSEHPWKQHKQPALVSQPLP